MEMCPQENTTAVTKTMWTNEKHARDFELGGEQRFHLYPRADNLEELNRQLCSPGDRKNDYDNDDEDRMMPMKTIDVTLCKILYQCMHSISDLH